MPNIADADCSVENHVYEKVFYIFLNNIPLIVVVVSNQSN